MSTRDKLLDAAFDAIADGGLTGLALEDVAARAGVSRQTVYRHFGSRDGLVQSLVDREEHWFIDRVVAAAELHEDASSAVAAGVAEALHAAREHPLLRRLLEVEPGAILPVVVLGRGPVLAAARPVLAALLAERLERGPADIEWLADVCSRLVVSYVLDPGQAQPAVVGDRVAALVVGPPAELRSESHGETFTP